jgi:hypothetical protein
VLQRHFPKKIRELNRALLHLSIDLNEKPPSDGDLSGSPDWDLNGNPIDWDASQSTSGKLDWDLNANPIDWDAIHEWEGKVLHMISGRWSCLSLISAC